MNEKADIKECLSLYDEFKNPLNKTIERGDQIEEGEYALVVLGILLNQNNDILLTKRSSSKKTAPGLWECTAGTVHAGEKSKDAVIREVYEETGLSISNVNVEYIESFIEKSAIFDLWFSKLNFKLEDVKIDKDEVDSARFVNIYELEDFITTHNVTLSLHKVLSFIKSNILVSEIK